MNLKERAKKLKQNIPLIFWALKDKDTPVLAKVMAGITVVYALSPIDFIPDFIPVLGYLDDIILLPALIAITVKLIPKEIWEAAGARERSRILSGNMEGGGKLGKWYYAIPIIVIWLLILWLIVKAIWF